MQSIFKTARAFGLATLVLGILPVGGALAGPLVDAATRAEQMATAGDVAGARTAIRNAVSDFSAGLPFAVGTATFVASDPSGFGMFEPRPNSIFKPGEKIVAYLEPMGLTWKPAQVPDKMETRFTVDFDLLDAGGTVLGSQKAFGNFTFTGVSKNAEIFATLTLDVSEAPVGSYVLRYHLDDTNSGRTAAVDLPFSIAGAP
ncbi:hypothetical protein C8J34_10236 [Rhizobium sp. PP-F2F-G36]|nr:hypothetical protein C8J34_10236 [Rhizobium sp. PP-F2F-G36]